MVLCPLATSTPGQLAMMNLIFYVPGCELALHRLSGIFAELDGPGVCANIISSFSYVIHVPADLSPSHNYKKVGLSSWRNFDFGRAKCIIES